MEHPANWAPTSLNDTPSSLTRYCSSGLSYRACAEHIQAGAYLNFPTNAYWFLYAQGAEEKQRYSVDIKIKDTQNLLLSKKLKTPDSTLPSVLPARIPALRAGNCRNRLAAGSKLCSLHSGLPAVFLLGWRMVLLKRQDPAWNIHLLHTNHHFRSEIIYTRKHILHISM